MQYVVDTYGSKYKIPGFEYREFLKENPTKTPKELKDANLYFFFFGSVSRDSSGPWDTPYTYWDGRDFNRLSHWLGNDWYSDSRLVLLEI